MCFTSGTTADVISTIVTWIFFIVIIGFAVARQWRATIATIVLAILVVNMFGQANC